MDHITPDNVLEKLKWHPRNEGPQVCMIAGQEIERLRREVVMLAKMAADGPAFFNPAEAMAAKQIRDRVLRYQCGMRPDGCPIVKDTP